MEADGCYLSCTAVAEWTNAQGLTTRKVSYRSAQLRLIRNNLRQMLIEIRADKANTTIKLVLKGINVLNRFMSEGKSTIKFAEERCTLFLSNAPAAQLITFLKTIFVKMTGQPEGGKQKSKNPLREQLLSNGKLGGIQDISPATNAELDLAKEKALLVAASRKTVTTPSPSTIRKRKLTDSNTPKVPIAKKLYANPTAVPLTDEQKTVLEAVLRGKNIFFTGSAGTGKSFLLKRIISELPPDATTATASTGVAACHIGGITLHQFSGIGLGTGTIERCCQMASKPACATVWRRTKYLIIDEISMVDGEYFEKIEAVARHVRKNDRPFGGIQLILCGDFFQLPPVNKMSETKKFCFQSKAWEKCVHLNFELQIVHRQKDPKFIKILNSLRIGRITDEITTMLKSTSSQKIEKNGILATRLCSHVNEANDINESQLANLKGTPKTYVANDSDPGMTKTLDQQLPVPGKLTLKVGAQVMLLKNINISNGLVNGARGVVVRFEDETPVIQFRSGEIYHATFEKWSVRTTSGNVIRRKQIPLKLAWAFSIHKSQGLTLDCVEMSLAKVFDAGQAYVALSRAQSLDSLRVLDFSGRQVWANTSVLEFYRNFRRHLHDIEFIPLGKKSQEK
ncbi:ATP-dependent DNA helicase PIF1 [Diachasmimorpha longicaudata]|uniref:ATP-dependent DNA helicase PIF1 n=1 Tax=Diachasmimorpha longicaudata TaxID=58733 RepID=UPI0030B8ACA3